MVSAGQGGGRRWAGAHLGRQRSHVLTSAPNLSILKAHDGTDLTSNISGTYANNKADCSTPVFKTVTPKSTIVIRELTTNETNNGTKYSTSYTQSGPSGVYKSFKFDIVITGYGVKSDIGADNARTAILHELGGTDTTV